VKKAIATILACVIAAALIAGGCSGDAPRDLRQARARYEAGAGLINQRQYDRAIEEFDQALQFDPDYAEAYCDRGIALYMKGEHGRAFEDFERALDKDPTLGKAHFHRAMLLDMDGKTDEAIKAYETFIRYSQRSPEVYIGRANKRLAELKGGTAPLDR
jgi:tetratricopeptide (TPR) repeat protein